jgi:hypothetical protein
LSGKAIRNYQVGQGTPVDSSNLAVKRTLTANRPTSGPLRCCRLYTEMPAITSIYSDWVFLSGVCMKPVEGSQRRERYALAVSRLTKSSEADIEFCREIYWQLRSDYLDYGKLINRWTIYTVVSACLFFLVNRNLVGSASVFGITLDHLSFLAYFLPPAVAFCIINITTAVDEQSNFEALMANLAKVKFPGLYESKIYLLFTSGLGLFSSDVPDAFVTRHGKN